MANETIKLFGMVSFPIPAITDIGAMTDPRLIAALNLEMGTMGYTIDGGLKEAFRMIGDHAFREQRDIIVSALATISGADTKYRRLFNDFPYSTPDQNEYMEKRVLGHISNVLGVSLGGNRITALSCGHVIDSSLFDLDSFGACPICQHAVVELSSPDSARFPFASVTPLKPLGFSMNGFVAEANTLLARQSSLSKDEKTFLTSMKGRATDLKAPEVMFRETLPFVYATFGPEAVRHNLKGATDLMRVAAYLSNPEADLSLKANTKYRLSTAQRKQLLADLNAIALQTGEDAVAEDLMRQRERWLRLGEKLKPNSPANAARYPVLARAFARLRNDPKSIQTFTRDMEKGIRSHTVNEEFVRLMARRPGEYARKLDFMLRTAEDARLVVAGFETVVGDLSDKLLLELRKYLDSRNTSKQRIFFPKGQANKAQIVPDTRGDLPVDAVLRLIHIIDTELKTRFCTLPLLGKVFVDPRLTDILLPFNRRGDSSTSVPVSKGSRYAFNGDVLRMFIWWKNGDHSRVDVDLSIVYFDDAFENQGHVSFTRLSSDGIVHSGDITDAPNGASEFIDFSVKSLTGQSIRYVAMSVLSFSGQKFDSFPCFAGFMERDKLKSGKVYEPESVAMKFDLATSNTSHMPLIFDLKERKVIFADLATANTRYGHVANQAEKQTAMTEAVMSLSSRKPTVHDLVSLHAMARGEIVDTREEADVIYDLSDAPKIIEEGVA